MCNADNILNNVREENNSEKNKSFNGFIALESVGLPLIGFSRSCSGSTRAINQFQRSLVICLG